MSELIGKDIYVRLSDPSGKNKEVVTQHRVWDAGRFLAAMQDQHNGPRVKPEDRRTVGMATKADYDEHRKAARA